MASELYKQVSSDISSKGLYSGICNVAEQGSTISQTAFIYLLHLIGRLHITFLHLPDVDL